MFIHPALHTLIYLLTQIRHHAGLFMSMDAEWILSHCYKWAHVLIHSFIWAHVSLSSFIGADVNVNVQLHLGSCYIVSWFEFWMKLHMAVCQLYNSG